MQNLDNENNFLKRACEEFPDYDFFLKEGRLFCSNKAEPSAAAQVLSLPISEVLDSIGWINYYPGPTSLMRIQAIEEKAFKYIKEEIKARNI